MHNAQRTIHRVSVLVSVLALVIFTVPVMTQDGPQPAPPTQFQLRTIQGTTTGSPSLLCSPQNNDRTFYIDASQNQYFCSNSGGTYAWRLTSSGAGGIGQLTGDVTAGPGTGSQASTLATVNSSPGSYTNANISVNAKGLVTSASNGSGGGGFTPANGIFAGDSANDDDGNVIEPTFALTGFTCTGVTCTVTNSGTNNLAAGDWVNMRFSSAWTSTFSAPTDISYSTGYTLFKVLSSGLSSTQFEFSFASSGTCASTCGVATKATYNLPFNTANLAGLSGKLTPYVVIPNPVTEQALNTYYSTILHPLSEAVTGQPTYFIFGQLENDAFANGCTSAATIEAALNSLWAQVHADSSSVVVWSTNSVNLGQTGIGICSSGYQTLIALEQWLPLQGKSAANQASGQYWDGFVDVARVVNDPGNSSLVAGNGGFGPGGVNLAAAKIANVLLSGVSDPLDKRSDYFGSAPGVPAVGNGFMQIPTYDSVYTYQWFSASSGSTLGSQIMSLGTLDGYQHLTVNSDSPSTFNSTSQNSGNHYPSTAAVQEPSSSSTAFNYPIFGVIGPNLPTGSSIKEDLGRDNSTNDALRMQFFYAGSGSNSNYAIFGLYGANGLSIDGNGNVVIQGLSPSTSPICPHGTGGALTTSGCATGGITSPLTTKGDMWGYDTTNDRIPVGPNGDVMTADSTQALGVKWAAPATGSYGFPYTIYQEWTRVFGNGTSESFTFLQPAQSSGATLFLVLSIDGSATVTGPSGWTQDLAVGTANSASLYLYHVASAGQTSVSWSTSSTASSTAYYIELGGSRSLDQSSTNTSASVTYGPGLMPSITPASGSAVYAFAAYLPNSSITSGNFPVHIFENPTDGRWGLIGSANFFVPNARSLEGVVYAVPGSSVAVQPPPLVTTGTNLTTGAAAWATFSIK